MNTPGPWKARRDELHFGSVSTVVGGLLETRQGIDAQLIVQVGGWASLREQEANTRLIAAAPTLLNALVKLLAECNNSLPYAQWGQGQLAAYDAIAEATGD